MKDIVRVLEVKCYHLLFSSKSLRTSSLIVFQISTIDVDVSVVHKLLPS